MALNSEQSVALQALKAGKNIFLSGGAGVGKTFTIREFVQYLNNLGKNVLLTAPTGVAALSIGGVTLSRAFKIPFGALTYKKKTYSANDEIINADVIIIDEISMCRIDTFDFISNKILDANETRRNRGLSNIQLIVVGDFFQLPPVMTHKESAILNKYYGEDIGLGYAFMSKFWKFFDFYNIMLTKIERQHDESFINNLNNIRTGGKSYIEQIVKYSSQSRIDGAIELCGKRDEALEINNRELNKIPGSAYAYTATKTGDATENDVIADDVLNIKVGARVMTLVNDYTYGYNNGSLGTVTGLYSNAIVVKLDTGNSVIVQPFTWEVYNYKIELDEKKQERLTEYVSGTFTQFPLKLAYAITIHKSQGQTYEEVNISPYCWECGQLYVAISRAKRLDRVYFNYAPDRRYVLVSLNVIKFYNSIRYGGNIEAEVEKENTSSMSDMDKVLGLIKRI